MKRPKERGRTHVGRSRHVAYFLVGAPANTLLVLRTTFDVPVVCYHRLRRLGRPHGRQSAVGDARRLRPRRSGRRVQARGRTTHTWMPDVAEGTLPPAATFLTTAPEIGTTVKSSLNELNRVDLQHVTFYGVTLLIWPMKHPTRSGGINRFLVFESLGLLRRERFESRYWFCGSYTTATRHLAIMSFIPIKRLAPVCNQSFGSFDLLVGH